MSLKIDLLNGALAVVAKLHPEWAHMIGWFKANEEQALDLLDKLHDAVSNGGNATPVIEEHAPELAHAVKVYVNGSDAHRENAVRHCFGLPPLTEDEEKAWMDRATPPDDSRVGSG